LRGQREPQRRELRPRGEEAAAEPDGALRRRGTHGDQGHRARVPLRGGHGIRAVTSKRLPLSVSLLVAGALVASAAQAVTVERGFQHAPAAKLLPERPFVVEVKVDKPKSVRRARVRYRI